MQKVAKLLLVILSILLPISAFSCIPGVIQGCTVYNKTDSADNYCPCIVCNSTLSLMVTPWGWTCCHATAISNCYLCDSSYQCQVCLGEYGFNSAHDCVTCSPSLLYCNYCNYSVCPSCHDGYVLNSSNNCVDCPGLYSNCSKCTSTTCTGCNYGFGLDSSYNCFLCNASLSSCIACYQITTCLVCSYGYGINSAKFCEPCTSSLSNCANCNEIVACSICQNGYALVAGQCVLCSIALPGCLGCSNTSNVCISCASNTTYYLLSGSCYLCNSSLASCSVCFDAQTCTQCTNTSYSLVSNNTCQLCPYVINFCISCNSSALCLTCINNSYYLSTVCYLCNASLFGCELCLSNQTCIQCFNNTFALLSNDTCLYCSVVIGFCSLCSSSTECTACISNQYCLIPTPSLTYCRWCEFLMMACYECSNSSTCLKCGLGILAKNGCTKVKGCLQVNPNMSLSSNCLSCNNTQFYQAPVNNSCICKEGWLIGDHCGSIVGCINLIIRNSVQVCVSCSFNHGFTLVNGTCVCKQHYFQSESICLEICGDGYLFVLPCDDGNLISGDGCSSTCQVQDNYICKPTLNIPVSQCVFRGRVTLTVNQISRVLNSNSAIIAFDIHPFQSVITKMNISALASFSAPFCQQVSIEIVNEQIIVTVAFNQTITNEMANIFVQFDRNYIISPNFSMNFNMSLSNGGLLQYYANIGDPNQIFVKGIYLWNIVNLVIFAVGSFAYKMIGVQTIHVYQIILLLVVKSRAYPYLYAQLSDLVISYGQLYKISDHSNLSPINKEVFAWLGYRCFPFQDYFILASIQTIIIAIYIIFKGCSIYIKHKVCKQKQIEDYQVSVTKLNSRACSIQKDNEDNSINIEAAKKVKNKSVKQLIKQSKMAQNMLNCVYNWLLFPFLIGFLFHFIITLFLNQIFNPSYSSNFNLSVPLIFIIAIGKYEVCFNELKVLLIPLHSPNDKLLKQSCRRSYIPFYLIASISLFAVIAISIFKFNTMEYELSAFIVIANLTYILLKRPYLHFINNFAIVVNQTTLLVLIGWLIWSKYSSISYNIELMMLYILFGCMTAVSILSIIRTIFTFYQLYFLQTKQKLSNVQRTKTPINSHEQMSNMKDNNIRFLENCINEQQRFMAKKREKIMTQLHKPLSILINFEGQAKQNQKENRQYEVQNLINNHRAEFHSRLIK